MNNQLVLDNSPEGLRHLLGGRPVSPGDTIEVSLPGERWLSGRYQWEGDACELPFLVFHLGGDWEEFNPHSGAISVSIRLPTETVLRWPQ